MGNNYILQEVSNVPTPFFLVLMAVPRAEWILPEVTMTSVTSALVLKSKLALVIELSGRSVH